MTTRVLAAGLVALAALADAASYRELAFSLLAVAVPVAAVAALAAFGDALDRPGEAVERLQAALTVAACGLTLLAASVRAPFVAEGAVPALGVTAVGLALALFAVQGLVAGLVAFPRVRLLLGLET